MFDQQVRKTISDRPVAGGSEALEGGGVHAVDQCRRAHGVQDGLAGDPDVQGRQVVLLVEGAGQFARGDRMIGAVLHVVFARPQQLDRRARHLLGDGNGLPDIVGHAATAEAAAEDQLVNLALFGGQAGGFQHRGERRLAVLRSGPDLALVRRVKRRGVQRLHRGVVLVGIVVDRLDFPGGAGDGGLGVAVLVADESGLRIVEALGQPLADRFAGDLGVLAFVPDDRQRVERGLGVPPGVGDDGDGRVVDPHHLLDALHAHDLGFVIAFQLAAEYRAVLQRGVQHARQLDIDAVDHLAGGLVGGIEPLDALAGDFPVLRILQLDVGIGGRRQLGGGFHHLAVGRGLARRRVGDDAVGGGAFRSRHLPLIGGGLDQHDARGGAALADIILRGADTAAAAGGEIAPGAFARHALAGRRIFGRDFRPVAFEFFGDQLGKAGEGALAHFRSRDPDHDGVVGPDHHPDVDFGRTVGGAHHGGAAEGKVETEREAGAGRGGADDEGAAIQFGHFGHMIHDCLLTRSRRRG